MAPSFLKTEKIKNWYARYERPLSTAALVGGFVFDAVTLKRVDLFFENMWVGAHLCIAALGILLLNIYEQKRVAEKVPGRMHFWLLIVIQFMFGGLLSTFLVFYFRSATLATAWPFMLVLSAAFICNESFKQHYSRLTFQLSILFVSLYSFAIYIVPIILHQISQLIFILSGIVSLIIIGFFIMLLQLMSGERFRKSRTLLFTSIGSIFVIINALYFTNLIPPLPLSLKSAGVYHSLIKTAEGNYQTTGEPTDWYDYLRSYEMYHYIPGEPIYVYSAVFSPTALDTTVKHRWEYYDEESGSWITQTIIPLAVIGGRDGGYRTYSYKTALQEGLWRVDVETARGQDIGRIKFKVTYSTTTPGLLTEIQ